MATSLTSEQKQALGESHPSWSIEGEEVSRTFQFADFAEAMGFVNRVALAAEKADHHPDIDIRWNEVTLVFSTHSAGALTERDRSMVETIDGWLG
ncbi:MAG: 4a-hydroxytetrahydrobiopterin dehydratase [Actinomycetota bacterium]|jgi:4a-hydroxytetrahydrobiopterin dehydratase|nr:4a-hydroxytetrahydrobiopterin dehydratase [Actinomycetota bacterium]